VSTEHPPRARLDPDHPTLYRLRPQEPKQGGLVLRVLFLVRVQRPFRAGASELEGRFDTLRSATRPGEIVCSRACRNHSHSVDT
jgi:hypothetical protein